jgi:hypothetical protein
MKKTTKRTLPPRSKAHNLAISKALRKFHRKKNKKR